MDFDFTNFPDTGTHIFETVDKDSLRSLSSCLKIELNLQTINKYKEKIPELKHTKVGSNVKAFLWVLPKTNEPVAILSVEGKEDGTKWIQQLIVLPGFRRRGIGRQLVECAVNELGANRLSVRQNNAPAIRLYKRYGFQLYQSTQTMYFMKK